jgi:hypothetical protein
VQLRAAIDRFVTARVILVGGWVWFLIYAFPGYMSFDSTWQLAQARHVVPINDWQPPMMALIWRWGDAVFAGPFPMLVLQSTLFLVGTNALLRRVMSRRAAAIAAVALLLAPPNIVVVAVIWKDSQMAGFLVAGIAGLFSTQRRWRIAGYVCLFLATGVRYNAAAGTLPIILAQFGATGTVRRWRRIALAGAAWLGITALAFAGNALLVEEYQHVWQVGAAPVDIAGIINYADASNAQVLDETAGVPWHGDTAQLQARIQRTYRPSGSFFTLTGGADPVLDVPTTDAQRAAISAAWRRLVVAHPLAFAKHRLAVFDAQLKAARGVFAELSNDNYASELGHHATHSTLQRAWIDVLHWFDGTLLFRVSLYFIVAILLVPFARRDRMSLAILASGICHELGLLAVAPAVDYRYSQWMIACCLLAGVLVVTQRLASSRSRPD